MPYDSEEVEIIGPRGRRSMVSDYYVKSPDGQKAMAQMGFRLVGEVIPPVPLSPAEEAANQTQAPPIEPPSVETAEQIEARIRAEVEAKVRAELATKPVEQPQGAKRGRKSKAELAAIEAAKKTTPNAAQ